MLRPRDFQFAADAVVTGAVTVAFNDIQPVDPLRQAVSRRDRLRRDHVSVSRGRPARLRSPCAAPSTRSTPPKAYYLENSVTLAYTHRLFGEVDVQVRGGDGRSSTTAPAPTVRPTRTRWIRSDGSVGYNLRNRTRIVVNYEFARRRSPAFADEITIAGASFSSWLFAF